MDPALIDDPDAVLPNQVGSEDREIKNDAYAKGLRYDWELFVFVECVVV